MKGQTDTDPGRDAPMKTVKIPLTITEIQPQDLNPIQRHFNRHAAVQWINARLIDRAHHDVGRSIAVYDADRDFVALIDADVFDGTMMFRLATETHVRFWSIGV